MSLQHFFKSAELAAHLDKGRKAIMSLDRDIRNYEKELYKRTKEISEGLDGASPEELLAVDLEYSKALESLKAAENKKEDIKAELKAVKLEKDILRLIIKNT